LEEIHGRLSACRACGEILDHGGQQDVFSREDSAREALDGVIWLYGEFVACDDRPGVVLGCDDVD